MYLKAFENHHISIMFSEVVFQKLKVHGNPELSKSIGTIFFNNICSFCLCHTGNSCNIANIFFTTTLSAMVSCDH